MKKDLNSDRETRKKKQRKTRKNKKCIFKEYSVPFLIDSQTPSAFFCPTSAPKK